MGGEMTESEQSQENVEGQTYSIVVSYKSSPVESLNDFALTPKLSRSS
jgi:hypothetical protein